MVDPIAKCPGCGMEFRSSDISGLGACPVCGRSFSTHTVPSRDIQTDNSDVAFKNPANGYVERIESAWAWVLVLGCIYFAMKGVWTHAVAGLFLAIVTGGISWLIYPIFAKQIMRAHYLRKGWLPVA